MYKLLIVDDSALMRKLLVQTFEAEGDYEIRLARNGREALEEIAVFRPDVVTLDINMPEMDGLSCLSLIMAEYPCPVVMVSSLTEKGAVATFEALALGAVDYIPKPDGTISLSIDVIRRELVNKIRAAAKAKVRQSRGLVQRIREQNQGKATPAPGSSTRRIARTAVADHVTAAEGCVLVGVSTGGPRTLEDILPLLPADFPWPVVVAQHMPGKFTGPFASRMNTLCSLEVVEVKRSMPVQPGRIYIAKGEADLGFLRRPDGVVALPKPLNMAYNWHPSVEMMVQSALNVYNPEQLVGVMLTGMGNDGMEAMTQLRQRGGRTIAESEETAVVFGMPGELIAAGGASIVLPCQKIARQLQAWIT